MTREKSTKDRTDHVKKVDFSGLVLGFSSAALYYLGQTSIEGKGSSPKNLPLAMQNIQIIELLKQKTEGNLTDEENKLIQEVLLDLKMKYSKIYNYKFQTSLTIQLGQAL